MHTRTVLGLAVGVISLLLMGVAGAPASGATSPPEVNPADYPALDDKELGHIRQWVKLSRQLPGDWSGMDDDAFGTVERLKMFQIGYMAAGFALVQHNYTPAYRELCRESMDALLQKLTLPDIWEYWINSSRVGSVGNPNAGELAEGWIDPVRRHNIFLKGYLVQSASLYEMLYRDGKYNKPDAFTFRYVPNTWGNGPVTFRYSLPDLVKIVHKEFVDRDYEGVLCEPNRMYPACNQPPILGLITYDQVYGTEYSADVMPKFKASWLRKGYTNSVTKQNVAYVAAEQDKAVEPGSDVLDGWAGAWMAAWAPDLMTTIYPGQRALYLNNYLNGAYAENAPPPDSMEGGTAFISLGLGLFGFTAAEMGDKEARRKLLEYAERNFNPIWEDGAYYYPRSADYRTDEHGNSRGMDTWTGNVLLPLIRLNKGGGFRRIYTQPWGKDDLEAPHITDVDQLVTNVSQAYYDKAKRALIVTIKPGPIKADRTKFLIRNLDQSATYSVTKDGHAAGTLSRDSQRATPEITWQPDGTIAVETPIDRPHSFVFVAL